MALDQKAIIGQMDTTLNKCEGLTRRSKFDDLSDLPEQETAEAVGLLLAAIERFSPPGSSYLRNAKVYEKHLADNVCFAVKPLIGILRALRSDYESGHLQSIVELGKL